MIDFAWFALIMEIVERHAADTMRKYPIRGPGGGMAVDLVVSLHLRRGNQWWEIAKGYES